MQKFLASSEVIDWMHPSIILKARELSEGCHDPAGIAKHSFEFVRDRIRHSGDYKLNPATCRASDVLLHGTGYCYAKSHLLAALLRANAIPAGLCYQRLAMDAEGASYCLHGLNAAFLPGFGWYRMDARGNRPGVDAGFCPPREKLAFEPAGTGEGMLPEIWDAPLPVVVSALEMNATYELLNRNLPDIVLMPT